MPTGAKMIHPFLTERIAKLKIPTLSHTAGHFYMTHIWEYPTTSPRLFDESCIFLKFDDADYCHFQSLFLTFSRIQLILIWFKHG